jgi:hypothetical protein
MTETLGEWEQPGPGVSLQSEDLTFRDSTRRELERLYAEVRRIEAALEDHGATPEGLPGRMILTYHALAGLLVGFVSAASSLLFNVVGSLLVREHPLQIIRVYLTFPFGTRAMDFETGPVVAAGILLYLLTGACLGILFHAMLAGFLGRAPTVWRFLGASALGLLVWVVNFYLILAWLQPIVTGTESILLSVPAWLGASTHLVYAWTAVLVENRARFGMPVRD